MTIHTQVRVGGKLKTRGQHVALPPEPVPRYFSTHTCGASTMAPTRDVGATPDISPLLAFATPSGCGRVRKALLRRGRSSAQPSALHA